MPKYINADQFLQKVQEHHYILRSFDNSKDFGLFDCGIKQIINKMPSADVVEVKHGEWKRLGKEKYINLATANEQYKVLGYPHRNIEHLRCSECGMLTLVDETIAYDFCPHCGADMRGNAE